MIERLALPAWDTAPTPLSAWVERLQGQGLEVVVDRESPEASWLEVNALRLRGYAVTAGLTVEAINFELAAADPAPALAALEAAAAALAWELHDDEDDGEDNDEPDD
jgi:hypothetical protein